MRTRFAGIVAAVLLSGCIGVDIPPPDLEAVPVGPLNAPFARPDGNGPPIECRGLPRDHCDGPGSIEFGVGGAALEDVDWVIVSCIGTCAPSGGEFRIDVVEGEFTREVGSRSPRCSS
jgi:hypothetical protein